MQPFQAGIGILAKNLDVPVVPMRIDGLYDLKKAGKWHADPGSVSVTVEQPVRYPPGKDPAEITEDLERRVAGL